MSILEDGAISHLDVFVVRQRFAESIVDIRSSNRYAVAVVNHQNLPKLAHLSLPVRVELCRDMKNAVVNRIKNKTLHNMSKA